MKRRQVLDPFSRRYQLPRRFFDRITQICIAQRWFHIRKHKRFRPTSFVKRNFFEETLALASLYLPEEDDQWESNRDKWRSRILSADLPRDEQDRLIRLLRFTPKTRRRRHRRPRNMVQAGANRNRNEMDGSSAGDSPA